MKCAPVLLAAVLFVCSFHTCATSKTDTNKIIVPILNMRYNNLVEGSPADVQTKSVSGTVTGNFAAKGSNPLTGTVSGEVTGTATAAGTRTFTGTVTCTVPIPSGGTDPCTITALSGGGDASAGTLKGSLKGTLTGTGTFTDTLTCTAPSTLADPLTCAVAGATSSTNNGVTFSGALTSARKGVGAGPSGPDVVVPKDVSVVSSTTTTEAPDTTTTSTAAPTQAPQQSTEKPTNPTEGKTDSSNSHVASHVALFIGTIALLSGFL